MREAVPSVEAGPTSRRLIVLRRVVLKCSLRHEWLYAVDLLADRGSISGQMVLRLAIVSSPEPLTIGDIRSDTRFLASILDKCVSIET
jgi:hypothetical protein